MQQRGNAAHCVLTGLHGPWVQTVTRGQTVDNVYKSCLCSYLGVYLWVSGCRGAGAVVFLLAQRGKTRPGGSRGFRIGLYCGLPAV